jgi:F-type H+-transporting ATPase subunit b
LLDFNYTLLIQFLNILILLILLNFLLFRPVLNVLNKRRAFMQALADKVQKEEKQAVELIKSYEDEAKERRRPILEQRDTTVKEAQTASMKAIEEARQELTIDLEKMKERVRTESSAALQRLLGEADRLSQEVVHKVLKRSN